MFFDRPNGDNEFASNGLIGGARHQQPQHLTFAPGEGDGQVGGRWVGCCGRYGGSVVRLWPGTRGQQLVEVIWAEGVWADAAQQGRHWRTKFNKEAQIALWGSQRE